MIKQLLAHKLWEFLHRKVGLGYEVLTALVMKSTIFWDTTSCSPLKVKKVYLPPASTLVFCSAYSLILKMEAICSSETSIDYQRTTRRCIPEDVALHHSSHLLMRPSIYLLIWASNLSKIQETLTWAVTGNSTLLSKTRILNVEF
jgi:hypothetical protein